MTATRIALRLRPDVGTASMIEPPGFLLHHWQPGQPFRCLAAD